MSTIWLIIIILVFSAFFSGMEIAFVSSNKLRFELDKKQQGVASSILSVFYDHPQQYISTMLVGNNICLVVYGMLMAEILNPYLVFLGNPFLVTLVQTVIATVIVLITGEFLPKTIFRTNPNLWLNVFSPLLFLFYVLLYPVSSFSTWVSKVMLRLCGVKRGEEDERNTFSRIDFNYLVEESLDGSEGETEMDNEVKMLQNALDFSNVRLRDCFVPRPEIVALDYEQTDVETLKQTFIETGLSKIIIYKGNIDNVVGYIHSSEMFTHQADWKEHIYSLPIVPENMAAQKLMKICMRQKKSIAVVVDEFGGTAGIVTLEDIFEEIFGEIEDEHDTHEYVSEQVGEHEYVFSGRLEVEDINEKYGLDIPESDEYETIAGFLLYKHQHFPKLNEVVRIGPFTLKCTKVTNNRIELIRLTVEDNE